MKKGANFLMDSLQENYQPKEISIEDLLGRGEVKLNQQEISSYIFNKVVAVTGAGGSIGSELCRQIIRFNPKRLVMIDINENGLYMLEQEFNRYRNQHKMNEKIDTLELKIDRITATTYFKDKIFYNGELFEGYVFIKNLFKRASNRIIIIDAYLDYSVLDMLADTTVDITIYIASNTPITNREISLFQTNHSLNVKRTNLYHDRFIIIDDELYNIGSSIKDIGKKISHISKLDFINITELLQRYI
jgi:hypothetical protein